MKIAWLKILFCLFFLLLMGIVSATLFLVYDVGIFKGLLISALTLLCVCLFNLYFHFINHINKTIIDKEKKEAK